MSMKGKACQSCGMPMKAESDFGTDKSGGRSREYCRFCFRKGKFSDQGITMEEKISKNVEIAKRMGMPEGKARELAERTISGLKRWKG
jgi:hypothetical protein